MRYAYPANLEWEPDRSSVTLTFDDLPGATDGATEAQALARAEDLLVTALSFYTDGGEPLPRPSPARGRPVVTVPPLVAAKLALHNAMLAAGMSNIQLGRQLGLEEKAARRLRDPLHRSHIGSVEAALRVLGKRLVVEVADARGFCSGVFKTARDAIVRACGFGGYGSWNAGLWICGVEEHGEGQILDDLGLKRWAAMLPDSGVCPPVPVGTTSSAWRMSFQLASDVILGDPKALTEFESHWAQNPNALLLSNMYPLPKPKIADWHLTEISFADYDALVRDTRVRILRDRRPVGSVVVCHGLSARVLAKAAFLTDAHERPDIIEDKGRVIEIYPNSKLILAPFFVGYLMPTALFEKLCEAVRHMVGQHT